ncbi:hypothetical protein GGI15_000991 [Coemansia interrupta]|uniref:Uncharacterized protein n=1 Tax=Coemansia interrupta TaxID=1126814 RepID=A0A9W8HNM2_9FUNG|nr:hypothetical protein GGI15_000991 [Coemansia interrupta]
MSLLNASQSLPDQYYGQFSQLSLLFDVHSNAKNYKDAQNEVVDDDDDDDELALSEIIAINRAVISPPTPAQHSDTSAQLLSQEPEELPEVQSDEASNAEDGISSRPSFSSLASRTRKISTALGSFRNLHRKIRSTATGAPERAMATTDSSSGDVVEAQDIRLGGGKAFRFNELVAVYETWNRDEYDRKGMPSAKLDSEAIEQIKHELNEFKVYEMQVHEDSRQHTHFIY